MKRSEINDAIRTAVQVLEDHEFHLPPCARWTPEQWREAGPECDRVKRNGLGWDVSDWGGGDFPSYGGVLFTLRNGNHGQPELGTPYAEKIIVLLPGQKLPLHFHETKTEDIINRGGGILMMELYNTNADNTMDTATPVTVFADGVETTYEAGKPFAMQPGESITLTPRVTHRFWASEDGGVLICGEVSSVNDDVTDNVFFSPVARFADVEEDEAPLYPLCNEYML